MSLYYEAAAALTAPASDGGNLKTRIFGPRSGSGSLDKKKPPRPAAGGPDANTAKKAPPGQVYALAIESCKWSEVLSEAIDRAALLTHERRRLTPILALLLVHDLLLGKAGVQLPPAHGLRTSVERHKARLAAELTRARLRRRAPTMEVLREQVERAAATATAASSVAAATRWVRVNRLKSTLDQQLATTFAGYTRVDALEDLFAPEASAKRLYVDEHVPDLLAVPLAAPSSSDLTRCDAYKSGAIIFQDKASCFPAYLLDPACLLRGGDSADMIDACAAPGNKTSHLAALSHIASPPSSSSYSNHQRVFAFEKDRFRAKTLQLMMKTAGALDTVTIGAGQDFLQVDPHADMYKNVKALLLDPSCSGSGIVGRDAMPALHLPKAVAAPGGGGAETTKSKQAKGKKRKRGPEKEPPAISQQGKNKKGQGQDDTPSTEAQVDPSNDHRDQAARLAALSAFQLTILLHAFQFPRATRVTYSTCSIHAQENEHVVVKALAAAAAAGSGWRLLRRDEQVGGMKAWPVRGEASAVASAEDAGKLDKETAANIADGCIRSYADDGRGVMGFFVAAFVRDERQQGTAATTTTNGQKDNKVQAKSGGRSDSDSDSEDSDESADSWSGFDD